MGDNHAAVVTTTMGYVQVAAGDRSGVAELNDKMQAAIARKPSIGFAGDAANVNASSPARQRAGTHAAALCCRESPCAHRITKFEVLFELPKLRALTLNDLAAEKVGVVEKCGRSTVTFVASRSSN